MELQSAELEETPKRDVKGKGLIVQQFYQKLFSVSTTFEPELADTLLAMTPSDKLLPPLPRETLALPFTENELKEALEQCGSGSAPGIDGLPFEFWKNIKGSVLKAFTETCNDMANNGRTVEWPVLIGSLLHKKGDRKLLNHYRLLSILDSDLRWRAKAILTKLMTHCEHFISEQQTALVKKRQISDNVMAVMLAIEETRICQKEGMILALDQEKAYDRVRWDWMFRVLEYIGVPDEMIKTIKASYQGPVVRISINKHLNPNLAFERGVLQGDPLSVLLYIITIQPLLYGLRNKRIGIQVCWEGKTATLSSMAHADDLIVFIANEMQYDELQNLLALYCRVSDAVMHPAKTTAIFAGEETLQGRTGWHAKYTSKAATDDFTHLGCPMRADGNTPSQALQGHAAMIKRNGFIWNLSTHSLPARIDIMNSYVLSKIWHPTQLCPLYEDYKSDIQRTVTSELFTGRTSAPILFEHICYPRKLGGLGLINPTMMMVAMNGKAVGRMIADSDQLGTAFKLQFLRTIYQQGGCFFRLLARGKWPNAGPTMRMPPVSGPPFWRRIYDTLLSLNLSVSEDWDNYTDEEILNLPYDLPAIGGEHTDSMLSKRARPSLFPLRIFLLRDILVFKATDSIRFQYRNSSEARELLQQRFVLYDVQAAQDAAYFFRTGQKSGPYATACSAMGDLRRYWAKAWADAPQKFKQRIARIRTLPAPLAAMGTSNDLFFPTDSIFDLVPWSKLTIAGAPCAEYTVKKGRNKLVNASIIQPNWTDIVVRPGEGESTRKEKLWKEAWSTLCWKHRPIKHFEPCWRLLHKRPQRMLNIGVPGVRDYTTGTCHNCNSPDNPPHAYVHCPPVQAIWNTAAGYLRHLIQQSTIEIDSTLSEIVLGFPELRNSLPEELRMRVVLWHSAVIYTIADCRHQSLDKARSGDSGIMFEFDGWEKTMAGQIRETLWSIYEDMRVTRRREEFQIQWAEGNNLITMQNGKLVFRDL
jgi:hypothetical protein